MNLKKSFIISTVLLCLLITAIISCNYKSERQEVNRKSEIDSVKVAIHSAIGWAKNKDFKLLYGTIANDSNYIEVDPGQRVVRGFDEFKKNESFWGSSDFKAIKYDIRDLTINLSEKGNVAWFYCVLDDINEWKGQPASWMNTRWTGVLEKRKGKWIMVQMHFSFAKG